MKYCVWVIITDPEVHADRERELQELATEHRIYFRPVDLSRPIIRYRDALLHMPAEEQDSFAELIPDEDDAAPSTMVTYWLCAPPEAFETIKGQGIGVQFLAWPALGGSAAEHAHRSLRTLVTKKRYSLKKLVDSETGEPAGLCFVLPMIAEAERLADIVRSYPKSWHCTAPYSGVSDDPAQPASREPWAAIREHFFAKLVEASPDWNDWPPLLRLCAVGQEIGFRDWEAEGAILHFNPDQLDTLSIDPGTHPMANLRCEFFDSKWQRSELETAIRQNEQRAMWEAAEKWGWPHLRFESGSGSIFRKADVYDAMERMPNATKGIGAIITPRRKRNRPPLAKLATEQEYNFVPFVRTYFSDLEESLQKEVTKTIHCREEEEQGLAVVEETSIARLGVQLFAPALHMASPWLGSDPNRLVELLAYLMKWSTQAVLTPDTCYDGSFEYLKGLLGRMNDAHSEESNPTSDGTGQEWRVQCQIESQLLLAELVVPPHRLSPIPPPAGTFILDQSPLDFATLG